MHISIVISNLKIFSRLRIIYTIMFINNLYYNVHISSAFLHRKSTSHFSTPVDWAHLVPHPLTRRQHSNQESLPPSSDAVSCLLNPRFPDTYLLHLVDRDSLFTTTPHMADRKKEGNVKVGHHKGEL